MSTRAAARPPPAARNRLTDAFAPLAGHFRELEDFMRGQVDAFEPEVRDLVGYALDSPGKRIRPALLFFSGWGEDAPAGQRSALIKTAAIVEMVHLATLVHDDIMDGASIRRGRPTVVRRDGPATAVLLGDVLFSQSLRLAAEFPDVMVCREVSAAVRRVCSGEIIQTLNRGHLDVTRESYLRIIELKTAELFRVSCLLGARVAGRQEGFVRAASDFGRHLGIAYQIYDDLGDFMGSEERTGKTLGTDFASGKLTLPLLLLLERLPEGGREAVKQHFNGGRTDVLGTLAGHMKGSGVVWDVAERVRAELEAGRRALESAGEGPASRRLLGLAGLLEGMVGRLEKAEG